MDFAGRFQASRTAPGPGGGEGESARITSDHGRCAGKALWVVRVGFRLPRGEGHLCRSRGSGTRRQGFARVGPGDQSNR